MKRKTLILINILIIIFEIIALFLSAKEFGYKLFTYYTQYSNILALISSVLLLIYLFKNRIPKWLKFFRYIVAHLLTMTFLIVAFVLVPMLVYVLGSKGFMMFTYGSMLYHHLLCPILFFVSFILLEKGCPITKKDPVYVQIPTCIYGITMIILNILQLVDGPYPFFRVLHQPVYITTLWMLFIIAISYFVGLKIYKISKASIKNN